MKIYRNVYEIIIVRDSDALAGIDFGEDGYADFIDFIDDNENEIHAVFTDRDLDNQLNLSDGVVSWSVTDGYGN